MKFSCAKSILNEAVAICSHAVSPKSTESVIEGILISAEDEVKLTGYNYKIGISKTVEATVYQRGAAVINARVLGDIIRKMADETVTIEVDERPAATITCGVSQFNIMAMSVNDFPTLPDVEKDCSISLPDMLLKKMINQTVFAVSDNENKPTHTGALYEVENGTLTTVAVDGYRLALRSEAVQTMNADKFRFIVPGDSLKEISRILPDDEEPCVIYTTKRFALFEFASVTVITRLLEGEFIQYRNAIPETQPVALRMNKAEFIAAVERVAIIVSERLKNPVHLLFEGKTLKLSCVTPTGRSYDELSIPETAETIEIGFNNSYLLDALKACPDDEIIFEIKSGLAPCTIRPVDGKAFVYLVLPVRLKAGE